LALVVHTKARLHVFIPRCLRRDWLDSRGASSAIYGLTALMLACQNGHRDVAELLLDRGAEVGQASQDGLTALMMWACTNGHRDVAELLLDRGAGASKARWKDGSDICPRYSACRCD
jgi:ankyrin repeat protein